MERPQWWDWELAFTAHVETRMEERGLSEVELRGLLEDTTQVLPATRPGRWLAHTSQRGRPWVVVLEPDEVDRLLFVVTAYAREI